jgi:hypothetical protein
MKASNIKKDSHCIKPNTAKTTKTTKPKNSISGARNSKKNQ